MMPSPFVVSIAIAAFLIAGLVKGVIGKRSKCQPMRLPTVGIAMGGEDASHAPA
jgi:hypothetical protein